MSVCPEACQMTTPDMRQLWLQQQVPEDRVLILSVSVHDKIATVRRHRERELRAGNVCQSTSLVPLYSGLGIHEQRVLSAKEG
eukprot:9922002-Heterocapsa_arctica.AAC.1